MTKKEEKSLAKERIDVLFNAAKKRPSEGKKYVELAAKIGERHRVHLPKELKRKTCKHCRAYLKPGVNCTIRLSKKRGSHIVVHCEECDGIMRIPYKSKP